MKFHFYEQVNSSKKNAFLAFMNNRFISYNPLFQIWIKLQINFSVFNVTSNAMQNSFPTATLCFNQHHTSVNTTTDTGWTWNHIERIFVGTLSGMMHKYNCNFKSVSKWFQNRQFPVIWTVWWFIFITHHLQSINKHYFQVDMLWFELFNLHLQSVTNWIRHNRKVQIVSRLICNFIKTILYSCKAVL